MTIAVGPFSNRSASEEEALKSVSYCENEIESGSVNVNDGVVCATAGALKATAILRLLSETYRKENIRGGIVNRANYFL